MSTSQTAILSEILVLNAQAGDREALSGLVELWTPRLSRRAYWLTRDVEGSQEVLQETWIGIARGLRGLREPAMFGGWAHRIVHHKAADWIKERGRDRDRDRMMHGRMDASMDGAAEDHAEAIRVAVSCLDPKLRDVVYLFYMDNCTLEQIGAVLGIPVGTAKTRLHKARALLKPMLERST